MASIHPTAIIADGAQIAEGVEIGPYCLVGARVSLGRGVRLYGHVVIDGDTIVGADTQIFPFTSIGLIPQDKKYAGEDSRLIIGDNNVIREHVTMNPGTSGGGGVTRVGNGGLFMVGSHIAHDCQVGDNVILANNATVAGHCQIGSHVILGGLSALHQFVRIGDFAFVGGMAGVEADVIPYGMALGNRASLAGLNIVGMKRHQLPREQIHTIRKAYRELFADEGTLMERVTAVETAHGDDEGVRRILDFIKAHSDRSFCVPKPQ
jgi:UDP-N-acetylglucosamine acyltransferase